MNENQRTQSHCTFKFLTISLLLVLSFLLSTNRLSAQISLKLSESTMGQALELIKKQSGYNFFYDDRIAGIKIKAVQIVDKPLAEVLNQLFADKNIDYRIEDKIVYLSARKTFNKAGNTQKEVLKVTGKVIDEQGEALIGVNIRLQGTSTGVISDIEGNFSIEIPSPGVQLQFSHIGYIQQLVNVESQQVINIKMRENTQMIDEIVVTALGIKREKRLLGYSMQELKGESMNQTGNASITGALQGKVAGVQMNMSATGLNGSTKITIRGNSSLTDNNQPLWVVDGIPFGDESSSSVSVYGGIDRGGASIDLNPEDIESVSILKGPNAAALYGSRAGNGVILVTTKKGSSEKGLNINYSSNLTWTTVSDVLDMQSAYGQGLNNKYSKSVFSYGEALDGRDIAAWWKNAGSETIPYSASENKLKEYFNTGFSQNHTVSIGTVTENAHYRSSFGYLNSKGLFEGENLQKYNLDINSGMKVNKFLHMDSKISLSRTTALNRPFIGLYGEMYQLLYVPQNISLADLKEHRSWTATDAASGKQYQLHDNWIGPDQDYRNPYWMHDQRTNMDERWRAFGYHSVKADITSQLYATAKVSIDYYRTKIEETDRGLGLNIEDIVLNDNVFRSERNFYEMNAEFLLQGNNQLGEKIRIDYGFGGNSMYFKEEGLVAGARNMLMKGNWYINSAGQQVYANGGIPSYANQSLMQKKVNSLYGTFQIAYDDYLSFDMTGRNDWSSTLPAPHSYFYPSFNLSFVGTEFLSRKNISKPAWLTFGKLRASFAKAGKDTQPYSLLTYNTYGQSFTGPVYDRTKTYVSPDFKPEMNTSIEAGMEMKLLNNKLGFDFTYYRSVTDNQIMLIPATNSSTFENWRINAGSVQNQGFELALYANLISRRNIEFSIDVNLAHNNTIVNELHPDKKYVDFGVDNFFVTVGAVEGRRLGDIYAARIFKRNEEGKLVINKYTGLPQAEERTTFDKKFVLGNIQPRLLMSVSPNVKLFNNIHISTLVDMKFGGEIVSVTEAIATHYGTASRTLDRNEKVIIEGVFDDGTPNNKEISKEMYYRYIGDTGKNTGIPENFVYDASYIKLRELSIGYSVDKKILRQTPLNTVRFSFVARDLCYLLKHTPGTSPEGGFDISMYSQALDYLSTPTTRTMGFSVNVSF